MRVRMAALMQQRVILVYTHDSIGLGEDGPTHQPIEQLEQPAADSEPRRCGGPCDAVETAVAWCAAIERADGPTALVLTRQGSAAAGARADGSWRRIAPRRLRAGSTARARPSAS